jgi:hypothetical protein
VIRIRVNLGDSNQSKFGLKAISNGDCNAITQTMSLDGKTTTIWSKRGAMRKIGRVGGAATCGALTDQDCAMSLSKTCPIMGRTW